MKLLILGSSSHGNGYILRGEKESLLIECGVNISEAKKAMNFDLSNVVAALVSHEHFDHSKYAKEYTKAGIDLYASAGTLDALNFSTWGSQHRTHVVYELQYFMVGSFKVMPFKIKHDAACPFGYLIQHEESGVILFLTDTWYCPYKFKNLSQIICEVNFSEDILQSNIESGLVHPSVGERSRNNHMSLEVFCDLLLANDLTQVNNITLIHLSSQNSDSKRFKKEITEQTGKLVTIAEKGLEINFDKQPF